MWLPRLHKLPLLTQSVILKLAYHFSTKMNLCIWNRPTLPGKKLSKIFVWCLVKCQLSVFRIFLFVFLLQIQFLGTNPFFLIQRSPYCCPHRGFSTLCKVQYRLVLGALSNGKVGLFWGPYFSTVEEFSRLMDSSRTTSRVLGQRSLCSFLLFLLPASN